MAEVKDSFGKELPVVLGGFSQGAMTAMDVALSLEDKVNGVLMLSGRFWIGITCVAMQGI